MRMLDKTKRRCIKLLLDIVCMTSGFIINICCVTSPFDLCEERLIYDSNTRGTRIGKALAGCL